LLINLNYIRFLGEKPVYSDNSGPYRTGVYKGRASIRLIWYIARPDLDLTPGEGLKESALMGF